MDTRFSPTLTSSGSNPDAHSIVSEYIDYTEYLHCDIARSLSLIHKLDYDYGVCAAAVHEVATEYCALAEGGDQPLLNTETALTGRLGDIRKGIANPLNSGLADREESVAEAVRLYETVDRHFNRLSDIIRRLQKINVVPRQSLAPELSRDRGPSNQGDAQMRITLRLDGQRRASLPSLSRHQTPRTPSVSVRNSTASRKKSATRLVDEKAITRKSSSSKTALTYSNSSQQMVLESSSESDWDDPPNPRAVISEADRKSSLTHCSSEDGRRLPWFELQPLELAVLRKRMKKNSSWQPSDAMMLKQLEMLGRGVRGFRKWARRTGQNRADIEKVLEGGEGLTSGIAIGALKRSQDNKGMRLNVMKRAKREREKAEAAAAAAAQDLDSLQHPFGLTGACEAEGVSRQRSSIRRVSAQNGNDPRTEPISPGSVPPHKIKPDTNPKRHATLTDSNQPGAKPDRGQPHSVRKLRKSEENDISNQNGEYGDDGDDMPIDPNEPTYCLCNRISFGTMVGCDNDDCPKEWFHMECVQLAAEPPKTVKWYCPLCRDNPNSKRESSQKIGRKKRKIGR
ncbi:Inhibitor of growth member, variant 2 [Orbilia oligospora]|nr:Inhibitor of growth member, variant 2 [Orbilia oligospora]